MPIEARSPSLTLGQLRDEYLGWLEREVKAGRYEARTLHYYRHQLGPFVEAIRPEKPVAELTRYALEKYKRGWHSVQAVQRMFNWAVSVAGLIDSHPFGAVERPELGLRRRTLERHEVVSLLRGTTRPFRVFLVAMRHTLARPQEIRLLRWKHLHKSGTYFILTQFKGRKRRRDREAVRLVLLDPWMQRLVARLRARAQAQGRGGPDDPVFLNGRGRPWSPNAVRCAMRRARVKAGLDEPGQEERVVCYTFRHSAATDATANGVRDRQLADLMGHASTKTTARYQHLRAEHLSQVIEQATQAPHRRRA